MTGFEIVYFSLKNYFKNMFIKSFHENYNYFFLFNTFDDIQQNNLPYNNFFLIIKNTLPHATHIPLFLSFRSILLPKISKITAITL